MSLLVFRNTGSAFLVKGYIGVSNYDSGSSISSCSFVSFWPTYFDALLLGASTLGIVMSSWGIDTVNHYAVFFFILFDSPCSDICCLKLIQLFPFSFGQYQHALFFSIHFYSICGFTFIWMFCRQHIAVLFFDPLYNLCLVIDAFRALILKVILDMVGLISTTLITIAVLILQFYFCHPVFFCLFSS